MEKEVKGRKGNLRKGEGKEGRREEKDEMGGQKGEGGRKRRDEG